MAKRLTYSRLHPIFTRFQSTKVSKPLRVLFCGSDDFSSASLRALHAEQKTNPEGIASIDILCRPGKPTGRGLKFTRDVPIKAVADELGLPVHERDTFTGWELPRPSDESINLIIAVSFGLFVPPRILRSVEYGGLNVHPSMLPNFRGPAPLQHMIMYGSQHAGITLQTLDEKDFDHGKILSQTPQKDLQRIDKKCTYQKLLEYVTPMAANMLVQGIRDKVYVPPYKERGWYQTSKLRLAPKITAADREINWKVRHASYIDRRARALGRLWNRVGIDPHTTKRFIFEDIEVVPLPEAVKEWYSLIEQQEPKGIYHDGIEKARLKNEIRFLNIKQEPEDDWAQLYVEDGDAVIFPTGDRGGIRVTEITVEGLGKKPASQAMKSVKEDEEWELRRGKNYSFRLKQKGPKIRKSEVKANY